jgi:hypothetical protein
MLCIDTKGTRPGEFTIGKKYTIQTDDVLQVFVIGDFGAEYEWSVVKDLFIGLDEWREKQLNRLLK